MNNSLNIANNKNPCGDQVFKFHVYIEDINGTGIYNKTLDEIAKYCEQKFPDNPLQPTTWRWNIEAVDHRYVVMFLTQEDATLFQLSMT